MSLVNELSVLQGKFVHDQRGAAVQISFVTTILSHRNKSSYETTIKEKYGRRIGRRVPSISGA
jgi:hypothetical protein